MEYQGVGFRSEVVLSKLHGRMLKQRYFPVVGGVPKSFVGRNRRALDMNVARFENDAGKTVDREAWGLPVPNKEAAYLSLAKYAKDILALSAKSVFALNTASIWMERQFGPHMSNSRVKDLQEVVDGLDKTTSPGFPWIKKYATKRAMIDDWKEFSSYMSDDWERLRDPLYCAVFGNSLKEEIRPAKKIEENSLRTFTAGPIEMTIHGNRLFEDMNQRFYRSHLKTASVVGFSPLKGGWNELYRKLMKHRNGFALDESQYDSSLRIYLMWACAEFRWKMLRVEDQTQENLDRLKIYYRNLIHTLIITSEGVFVMKQTGNPSGSVNTIVDNTLILYMLLAYAWIMTSSEVMNTYAAFDEELSLALCGDDNTWTVSDDALPFFNARSVIEEWKRIGVTTTTDCLDPRNVEELDFLSAFTVFIDGIAVPLYKREKLLTSLLYSRSPDEPAFTLLRATGLLRIAWADTQMRGYLRELIEWLIVEYGEVLKYEIDWKAAMSQIPTERDLRDLFLGPLEGYPMVNQSFVITPEKASRLGHTCGGIKSSATMNQIGLPQRPRGRRQRKRRGGPPPLPQRGTRQYLAAANRLAFARPAGPRGRRRRSRKGMKRRNRGMGGNNSTRATGAFNMPGMPNGMRRLRRTPFGEDEFIVDLLGSTTFGNGANAVAQQFAVNPGNVITFPWLSAIAPKFEKYVFTQLEFYYKHEVSQFATAGTVGKAILSFDYDAADAPPTTKQQMMDTDPHEDKMPCEDFVLRVDCREAFNNGPKYVRPGNLPGGADIKTYDIGNLNYGASGTSDGTTKIGELHVRYAGWFEKPVLEGTASAPVNNQVALFQSSSAQTNATTVVTTQLVATAITNGLSIVNTAGSMVPPPGNYLIDYSVVGADSAAEAFLVLADFRKNGTSVWHTGADVPFFTTNISLGAGETDTLSGSLFVTANGTDAFTLSVTQTGTAGVLTAGSSVRWVAV